MNDEDSFILDAFKVNDGSKVKSVLTESDKNVSTLFDNEEDDGSEAED